MEPTTGDPDAALRARAVHQLNKKRGFAIHATTWAAVSVLLWAVWLVVGLSADGAWFPWPIFPTLGWAVGLFFHGLAVYGPQGHGEDRIQAEMRRISGA